LRPRSADCNAGYVPNLLALIVYAATVLADKRMNFTGRKR